MRGAKARVVVAALCLAALLLALALPFSDVLSAALVIARLEVAPAPDVGERPAPAAANHRTVAARPAGARGPPPFG